jgi:DNA-binding NtrC family response regulator
MTLNILIADDEQAARYGMAKALGQINCHILQAADGRAALDAIRREMPDLVFLDLTMPILDGQSVLRELNGESRRGEIIVVTAHDSVSSAVECVRLGASDYITKPFEVERLRAIARRAARRVELEQQLAGLQNQLDEKTAFGTLVGVSRSMRELFRQVERAARAPLDILICGETGTGKELIAREIHRSSHRAAGPFVPVNAAAIHQSLAESELFGHVRGSFTGADADHKGVFERAHGGTVFLDEIGDMPIGLQPKLLRTLQERTIQPVGSSRTIPIDVRVCSATHQDLRRAIEAGHFRRDLYYRIKGIELLLPPLRARREDILLLTNYFLDRLAARTGEAVARPCSSAVERLLAHHWPGNVRELEHVVTAAATMATNGHFGPEELDVPGRTAPSDEFDMTSLDGLPLVEAKGKLVEWFERRAIRAALEQNKGNVSAAARQLGMHRQSLQQKIAHWRAVEAVERVEAVEGGSNGHL